jgi:membrane-associated phospholipid phosphatase
VQVANTLPNFRILHNESHTVASGSTVDGACGEGLPKASPAVRTIACVRRSEWVLWAFLAYAAILAAVAPMPRTARVSTIGLNLALLAGYALLVFREMVRPRKYLSIARDWLPLLLTLLAFHEMGWFAVPHATHSLEARWVVWDRVVLRGGAKALIESLGPVLPSILEIAYLLVYALGPISVAMLYAYGRRNRVDQFLFLFLAGVLLCYAQFPFWPSEPPRTVFPTEDLPTYVTIFRRWNLWLLGMGGIHTSVFPSGHVAAAFSTAAGMWVFLPEHKWVGRVLGVTAVLIAVATVYGRYHYLADAAAGLLMAAVALLTARLLRPS